MMTIVKMPAMPSIMRRTFSRLDSCGQHLLMVELAVHERRRPSATGRSSRPGTTPARNSAAIDTLPATCANTIMPIEGGMIGPMVAAVSTMAVAKRRRVAVLLHRRDHHAPIEETSATAEPVTPPKNIEATHDDLREAARQPADQHLGHQHEAPRDAAARHQHAGEHEEDDGQQREGVDRRQHALHDRGVVDARQQEGRRSPRRRRPRTRSAGRRRSAG